MFDWEFVILVFAAGTGALVFLRLVANEIRFRDHVVKMHAEVEAERRERKRKEDARQRANEVIQDAHGAVDTRKFRRLKRPTTGE